MLKLYNTLTRKKEIFKPIKKDVVGIYTCGPTVYWYQHIGNLRSYIFADLLKRTLLYNKLKVKHVMNYTDVGHLTSDADTGEDKIEKAAKKEGKTAKEIANYYARIFEQDCKKLNILKPNIICKATEHIKEQIDLIKKLEKKGFTYKTNDGIYFDTSKLKNYGKLARLNIKNLQAGKRVEVGEKKHPTDFALWKFSEKPGIRQQEWRSPFGLGFPGWHIECSAMSMKYLGEHFDIHTGGEDHIPVHHTNEIAQSEAATGKKFVNYWIHGAFLLFKGEKVSKSKGGLYTISELEGLGFSSLDYRYLCLTTKYRVPLNFTLEALASSKNSLNKLKNSILEIKQKQESKGSVIHYKERFLKAINDDLNLPKALSLLWGVLKNSKLGSKEKLSLVYDFDKIFGLNFKEIKSEAIPKKIQDLIKKREKARKEKDYKQADEIREQIRKLGYQLEDTEQGIKAKKI